MAKVRRRTERSLPGKCSVHHLAGGFGIMLCLSSWFVDVAASRNVFWLIINNFTFQ